MKKPIWRCDNGIDGEYSHLDLVKRMITVCGVCCTFKCHRIMYNSLFTTVSSLLKKVIEIKQMKSLLKKVIEIKQMK